MLEMRTLALRGGLGLLALSLAAPALQAVTPDVPVARSAEAFAPVVPTVFSGDLRDLPKTPDWEPGDPIKEIPRRSTRPPAAVPEPAPMTDPLLAVQERADLRAPNALGAPILNFDGGGFTGVNPPDTVGDVGPNHYVQSINGSGGSVVRVFNKAGVLVAGPFNMESLGAGGSCASGAGDPIVLYDQFADRWLLSEFASAGSHLCVYVSQTASPVAGGWFRYDFTTPSFPDYPKYAVWRDAYYVGTNENPAVYALNRTAMLTGAAATSLRFTVPALSGFPFQMLQPADADGATLPPVGAPGLFLRHKDSESHGSPGAADTVEYFEFHADFAVPANSTLTGPTSVNVTEFDSNLCGLVSFSCIAQPSGANALDPLREVVMHRAQYRNFGTHQTIVGSFATDVSGTDRAGVRWFELRKPAATWTLFQEGTFSIDTTSRWMSSIAMDGSGNIALAYNVSSSAVFPGLRYTGRTAALAAGTMGAEQTLVAGTASNGSNRYGDYASLNVDPADGCTFWFTGEYNAASQWSTRIGTFKFPVGECTPVPVELERLSIE